jgi:hypothetical protein
LLIIGGRTQIDPSKHSPNGSKFVPIKPTAVLTSFAIVAVLIWADATVPYWGVWFAPLNKPKPAQMCSDGVVLDSITKMIRDATADMEKIYGNKSTPPIGSNGSYAPVTTAAQPSISVVVDGVLAVDFNSDIDRVKCEIAFHIDGAERTNAMAMLQGQGPQRKITYFVQADGDSHLAVSW